MALEADVAFEDHNWLHLRATKKVAQAFAAHNLFLGDHVDMPVNPDFIIRIPKTARFENFTSNHGQIYSAGAFSYSENGVTEAVVGRYCSIAHNFWAMGERHPMERVTQSSFTYCHFPALAQAAVPARASGVAGRRLSPRYAADRNGAAAGVGA